MRFTHCENRIAGTPPITIKGEVRAPRQSLSGVKYDHPTNHYQG